ncbi:MAG: hypothetical protein ACHQHM_07315 [Thermoanaerobaculales bacterium]
MAHQGTIRAMANTPHGTVMRIEVPKQRENA